MSKAQMKNDSSSGLNVMIIFAATGTPSTTPTHRSGRSQGQRIELRRALAEQRAAALVRHLDAELARKLISGCDLERVGHDAGHDLAARYTSASIS